MHYPDLLRRYKNDHQSVDNTIENWFRICQEFLFDSCTTPFLKIKKNDGVFTLDICNQKDYKRINNDRGGDTVQLTIRMPDDYKEKMEKRPSFFYGWVIVGIAAVMMTQVYGLRHSFPVFFLLRWSVLPWRAQLSLSQRRENPAECNVFEGWRHERG